MLLNATFRWAANNTPIPAINHYYRLKMQRRVHHWWDSPVFLLHVPKTAGTSICAALNLPDPGHLLFDEMKLTVKNRLLKKPCFMVVRDPIDRLVSTYFYAVQARRAGRRSLVDWVAGYRDPQDFLEAIRDDPNMLSHYFLRRTSDFYSSATKHGVDVHLLPFDTVSTSTVNYLSQHGVYIDELPRKKVSNVEGSRMPSIQSSLAQDIQQLMIEDYRLLSIARGIA